MTLAPSTPSQVPALAPSPSPGTGLSVDDFASFLRAQRSLELTRAWLLGAAGWFPAFGVVASVFGVWTLTQMTLLVLLALGPMINFGLYRLSKQRARRKLEEESSLGARDIEILEALCRRARLPKHERHARELLGLWNADAAALLPR